MSAENTIRVATWNIHGFFGEGRRPDFQRTIRLIQSFDADIVALQEIDGRTQFGREPFAFERLADALGGHFAEARLFGPPGREYGHGLWSRDPIREALVRRLPGPGFEPRAAIDALCDTRLGVARVVSTHFGLRPAARRSQARALVNWLQQGTPTLVVGDFNEWRANGPVARELQARLPEIVLTPTWPVKRPIAALDRIHASADLELISCEALVSAAPGSDHLPLLATFRRRR